MWGRQAIDKMKYIPPFPMKKLFLITLLIISSFPAFTREKKEAPVEMSVDEALKSCVGGPPQPSIKTTDLKELDEISVDEAMKSRIGCPHAIKTTGLKEGNFLFVLDGMIIDEKRFINLNINNIKDMKIVSTNTYCDYVFIRTKKGSRLSKQIPITMKDLGISDYKVNIEKR